ncbi:unnamed protein product [Vitrella brassicaformis CCMP3155]|uniref:SET domain-containing protein n=1 Tax=Vitrella brassicaformis (strain CCMP3155) TaxID=1169540 RepID=A0A0G4FP35_VITBC|nr:unnamed protein product [Vitrella brassicaformis CCMP3155]|eukprot:CEM15991.1 unnamed protein product [Vitrella brassicaformis CCMP3155]
MSVDESGCGGSLSLPVKATDEPEGRFTRRRDSSECSGFSACSCITRRDLPQHSQPLTREKEVEGATRKAQLRKSRRHLVYFGLKPQASEDQMAMVGSAFAILLLPLIVTQLLPSGRAASFVAMEPQLVQWVEGHGGKVNKVQIQNEPSDDANEVIRGLVAVEPLADGEVWAEIPLKLCITFTRVCGADDEQFMSTPLAAGVADVAKASGDSALMEELTTQTWDARLTIALLYELRNTTSSFYRPYLESLPDPPILPADWPREMMPWTPGQGKGLQHAVSMLQLIDQICYGRISALLKALPADKRSQLEFSEAEYNAVHRLAVTRSVKVNHPTIGAAVPALVPLFDMVNHHHSPNVQFISADTDEDDKGDEDDTQMVLIGASGPIAAGVPLSHDYGLWGGEEGYIAQYGFLPPVAAEHAEEEAAFRLGTIEFLEDRVKDYADRHFPSRAAAIEDPLAIDCAWAVENVRAMETPLLDELKLTVPNIDLSDPVHSAAVKLIAKWTRRQLFKILGYPERGGQLPGEGNESSRYEADFTPFRPPRPTLSPGQATG